MKYSEFINNVYQDKMILNILGYLEDKSFLDNCLKAIELRIDYLNDILKDSYLDDISKQTVSANIENLLKLKNSLENLK